MHIGRTSIAVVLMFVVAAVAGAQEKKPAKKQPRPRNPAYEQITDDPKLPRVLLLGDSISIGYTLPAREALKGKANVHRPATNCGPTTNGVANIDAWLGDKKWDVIHFNFGLHDLKYVDENRKNTSPSKGAPQVPLDQYEKNLDEMVQKMKNAATVVIFATTTPVPPGEPQRVSDDAVKYNEAALRVMNKHGVRVNDLHAFCMPRLTEIQRPANVHFTDEGSEALGKEVAKQIEAALPPHPRK